MNNLSNICKSTHQNKKVNFSYKDVNIRALFKKTVQAMLDAEDCYLVFSHHKMRVQVAPFINQSLAVRCTAKYIGRGGVKYWIHQKGQSLLITKSAFEKLFSKDKCIPEKYLYTKDDFQNQLIKASEYRRLRKKANIGGSNVEFALKRQKELMDKSTPFEQCLYSMMPTKLKTKVKRQAPIYIDNKYYYADFYFPNQKLVIEVDGGIHRKKKIYDAVRDEEMKSLGITVIRITNDAVVDTEKRNHLYQLVQMLIQNYKRKCTEATVVNIE